jgi:ATP-dependent Lon protease
MEVIRLSGYTLEEKLSIARRHLIPNLLKKHALGPDEMTFNARAIRRIIADHAREAGVRALEKALSACMRKVAAGRAEGTITETVTISSENTAEYLGKPRFVDDPLMRRMRPGVVRGLAWTPLGGNTLYVEAIAVPGERNIKLTGQLGEVMVESSHIAYSLVSSGWRQFGIAEEFFDKATIHLHVPAGATPKDGPSAGITMATALVSLALKRRVPARLAMTGELTLTGRVLPVGGIKEKVLAAKRSRVKVLILPSENDKDFAEIPEHVRRGLDVRFVSDYAEVYDLVFKGGLKTSPGVAG